MRSLAPRRGNSWSVRVRRAGSSVRGLMLHDVCAGIPLAYVCWGGLVDAVQLARCFGLGEAARLSDGPVARGKQGLVWRLDTADGSWAVKVPFHQSGEGEVRSATEFQEAAHAALAISARRCGAPRGTRARDPAGRQVRVYERVDLRPPDAKLDPARGRRDRGRHPPRISH